MIQHGYKSGISVYPLLYGQHGIGPKFRTPQRAECGDDRTLLRKLRVTGYDQCGIGPKSRTLITGTVGEHNNGHDFITNPNN